MVESARMLHFSATIRRAFSYSGDRQRARKMALTVVQHLHLPPLACNERERPSCFQPAKLNRHVSYLDLTSLSEAMSDRSTDCTKTEDHTTRLKTLLVL